MSPRLAAFGVAAALFGAAVFDSASARPGHGRSGGSSGSVNGMSSGHVRSGAAMPSGQFRAGTQFRAQMSSGQVRSAPLASQPVPGTRHVHPGRASFPHHKNFHHGHKHAVVTTAVVFPAYYPYYPYYPFYPYNGFYPGPAPAYAPPAMWYFCPALGAYYPYVQECPSGWQAVQPGSY